MRHKFMIIRGKGNPIDLLEGVLYNKAPKNNHRECKTLKTAYEIAFYMENEIEFMGSNEDVYICELGYFTKLTYTEIYLKRYKKVSRWANV